MPADRVPPTDQPDTTTDPALRSWVEVPQGSDFPIQNLPYGVFSRSGDRPRVGVAIGDQVLDLAAVAEAGVFDGVVEGASALFAAPALNPFLAAGPTVWAAARSRISQVLTEGDRTLLDADGLVERALVAQADVELSLPFEVADYVDFYSSIEHASNLGRILRPNQEPLLPNWRHLPIGYHGRAGTIVGSGTPVVRPLGQRKGADDPAPVFGPSIRLDIETEIGFVTGPPSAHGAPVSTAAAAGHIFGLVLVNDWSARDIQAWEYQPLGPFLSKSFATSISPWVVPLAALAPYRIAGPVQDPTPLPYLHFEGDWNYDLSLEVQLSTEAMRSRGDEPFVVSRPYYGLMYWNMLQQLAHATVNGASVRTGDLFASGTISGPEREAVGSFIERTWNGTEPLALPDGTERRFLEDGDEITLTGWCGGGDDGRPRIGFGEVRGRILPAPTLEAPPA